APKILFINLRVYNSGQRYTIRINKHNLSVFCSLKVAVVHLIRRPHFYICSFDICFFNFLFLITEYSPIDNNKRFCSHALTHRLETPYSSALQGVRARVIAG
ncbi:hypothetical protein, partial [Bacteroides caecimuris]|uniref:hypothetical protein n=1 Tax=Bacteroides caecimuris TaxID=1796613 RepID=UPI00256FCD61